MARWIETPTGAVNLDRLAQLGVQVSPNHTWDIIGWSSTGERFAVQGGFMHREVAFKHMIELVRG